MPPKKNLKLSTVLDKARRWRGFLGAHDYISPHLARGACDIICFENRF